MKSLINDLLAYSRVGKADKPATSIDCEAVLASVCQNLRIAIEDNEAVITHDPLPIVMASESQLTSLFQNLISNALKYRSEGRPRIHIGVKQLGGEWMFSVGDNGIGIDAQYKDRIFVLFQRLHGKGKYEGTGIGLAICKKIVEQHGGRIWLESEPGAGTTFYFTVPANMTTAPESAETST